MNNRFLRWRRAACLLPAVLACRLAPAQAPAPDPQVVTITGQVYRELRTYAHYLPGLREFETHHDLAPHADLRFGVLSELSGKLLPLKHVGLERKGFFTDWRQDLPLPEEGWFTIPGPGQGDYRDTDIAVSWRGAGPVNWVIDVHSSDLPYRIYRLGDLRLECRVYLAIEWEHWHGTKLKGVDQPRVMQASGRKRSPAWGSDASVDSSKEPSWLQNQPLLQERSLRAALASRRPDDPAPPSKSVKSRMTVPPMDEHCGGPESLFVNTRPWPKLEAYLISEGGRTVRHALNGLPVSRETFELDLNQEGNATPWSDDALVEFIFRDRGHWQVVDTSVK